MRNNTTNNAARMTCCVFSTIASRVRWSEVRDWMPQSWRVELPQSDYPRVDENITINGSCGPHPDEILMDKEAGYLGAYMFANQDDDSINAALLDIAKMNGQAADFHDKRVALGLEKRRQRLRNLKISETMAKLLESRKPKVVQFGQESRDCFNEL